MEPMTTAALLLSSLVQLAGTGIGAAVNSSEMNKAGEEAKRLDARNFAETQKMNRFNMDMTKAQHSLQKDRFGFDKMQTGYAINQDQLARMENLLNNNMGLQNLVLSKWGTR